MDNGNYNSAEFSWEYSAGGQTHGPMQMNQGGRPGACGVYGSNGYGNSGSQWLHSNQGNTLNYQQAMSQGHGSESSPFTGYNNSMMQSYTNFYKDSDDKNSFGSMQSMNMGETDGGMTGGMDGRMGGGRQHSYGGYSNNGLDNPGQSHGHGQSQSHSHSHSQGWF